MFFTRHQYQVFAQDLTRVFLESGFEIVQEPYIDYELFGFRATYVRRYDVLDEQANFFGGILTTIVQVVGLPFGNSGKKMIVIATPKSLKNEQVAESAKLRLVFNEFNQCSVVISDHHSQKQECNAPAGAEMNYLFVSQVSHGSKQASMLEQKLEQDLMKYVKHLIQIISPGLIKLPTEIKLEILKKLSVQSVIKMSQVNNEFRSIIFQHGETLWQHLCWRDFNINTINRLLHRSWMELYRESYIIHQIEIIRKERALPGLPERPALPPAPYRLQIEWFPEVLALPIDPLQAAIEAPVGNHAPLAIEIPLRRADSLDSLA